MALVHSRVRIAAALVAWSAACDSNERMAGPDAQAPEAAFLAIVSNPVAIAATGGPAQAAAAAAEVAYVSLPPGTIPGGEMATIGNRQTGATVTTPVVGGGFDPVLVVAQAGDTLRVEVQVGGGAASVRAASVVPPRRRPIVVRTDPPPGKRDVPLNASIVIVFSEPIDPATLNGSAIQVLQNGLPVAGQLGFVGPNQLIAEFVPAAPLLGGANYELRVTQEVRDLDGEALEASVSAEFTTESPLPGGEQIAFVSTRDGGGPGFVPYIYVANADGSDVRRLTQGEMPAWSPDGRRIAFHRSSSSGSDILVIDADGSHERALMQGGANPAWSPDGSRIVFNSVCCGAEGSIFVMNADGSGVVRLLGNDFAQFGYVPTWSPDGLRIAFVRCEYSCSPWDWAPPELYIMNADGSGAPRRLSIVFFQADDSRPVWSPDGTRLLLQVADQITSVWIIASVNLNGSDFRSHMEASYAGHPDWSPDGRRFVFEKFSQDQSVPATRMRIYVMDAEGGPVRQLIPDAVAPVVADYSDFQPSWSRVRR